MPNGYLQKEHEDLNKKRKEREEILAESITVNVFYIHENYTCAPHISNKTDRQYFRAVTALHYM